MTASLEASGITAGYGSQPVIHDLDIEVNPGEIVALLGANGAGKTTTLLTLSGELPLMSGQVLIDGRVENGPLHRRARKGLSYVTEERSVFKGLSLVDNLRCGGVEVSEALALFPELEKRLHVRGGLLSGGEQQMLTLARALARKPRLLLADELSLGLAPLIVRRLFDAIRAASERDRCGILLVEQHVRKALNYADRVYVMVHGRIQMALPTGSAWERIDEIEQSYLAGRSSDGGPRGRGEPLNDAVSATEPSQNRRT
jgi:branched-chain amino acid transport system ATP-binding protein